MCKEYCILVGVFRGIRGREGSVGLFDRKKRELRKERLVRLWYSVFYAYGVYLENGK